MVDAGSSSASIIDTLKNTVVATIPVGADPLAIAIAHDLAHAYDANVGSNAVSLISQSRRCFGGAQGVFQRRANKQQRP